MKTHSELTAFEVVEAVNALRSAGFVIVSPQSIWREDKLFSVGETAELLSVSESYIKRHLTEFPGLIRMPGGELRISIGDLRKAMKRWRIARTPEANSEAA